VIFATGVGGTCDNPAYETNGPIRAEMRAGGVDQSVFACATRANNSDEAGWH